MNVEPDRKEGDAGTPLVSLLLVLTAVAGAVDAVSVLRLGHVFVGNMTGNVLFLGCALAGPSEFSGGSDRSRPRKRRCARRRPSWPFPLVGRRVAAVAAMLTGALAGTRLVLHTSIGWALATVAAILGTVGVGARWNGHADGS